MIIKQIYRINVISVVVKGVANTLSAWEVATSLCLLHSLNSYCSHFLLLHLFHFSILHIINHGTLLAALFGIEHKILHFKKSGRHHRHKWFAVNWECSIFLCSDLLYNYSEWFLVVLAGISILLPVYGITNSKRYSVFYGILILLVQSITSYKCRIATFHKLC